MRSLLYTTNKQLLFIDLFSTVTDSIHPEARLAHVFRGLPDISSSIQAADNTDKLSVSHPVDRPRKGELKHEIFFYLCVCVYVMDKISCAAFRPRKS